MTKVLFRGNESGKMKCSYSIQQLHRQRIGAKVTNWVGPKVLYYFP